MKSNKSSKIDLSKYTDENLLDLRIQLDGELKKRKIKFSVGELGETLTVGFFNRTPGLPNLQKAPTGVKNVDALSRDGHRYSIKSVQVAKKTGTIYPDVTKPDLQLFEFLVITQLDQNLQMRRLYRFSWEQFVALRAWDKRMNAWYVPLSENRLKKAEKLFSTNE